MVKKENYQGNPLFRAQRFLEPEPVDDPKQVMIVGVVGLVINVIGLFMFGGGHGHSHGGGDGAHGHSHATDSDDYSDVYADGGSVERGHGAVAVTVWTAGGDGHMNGGFAGTEGEAAREDGSEGEGGGAKKKEAARDTEQMNIRGVFLHVLADALGSIVVIISAGVILATDPPSDPEKVDARNYVDPALSVALVVIIVTSTWPLLRDSSYILMQTIPPYVDMDGLKVKMLKQLPEVEDIHEFHVWRLVGNKVFASVHAMLHRNVSRVDHMLNAKRIKVTLRERLEVIDRPHLAIPDIFTRGGNPFDSGAARVPLDGLGGLLRSVARGKPVPTQVPQDPEGRSRGRQHVGGLRHGKVLQRFGEDEMKWADAAEEEGEMGTN